MNENIKIHPSIEIARLKMCLIGNWLNVTWTRRLPRVLQNMDKIKHENFPQNLKIKIQEMY
jgi:hypothetical protein